MSDLKQTAVTLLQRYAARGSRADAAVAADALREAGYEEAADDVDFSVRHCNARGGPPDRRGALVERITTELKGRVLVRGDLPARGIHYRPGYAPPSRPFVAIEDPKGIEVWARDGYLQGGVFTCIWRSVAWYRRADFRTVKQLLDTVRLELELEGRGRSLDKWIRIGLDDAGLVRRIGLLRAQLIVRGDGYPFEQDLRQMVREAGRRGLRLAGAGLSR